MKTLLEIVSEALKNSGRTCDEDNWHIVMAAEAIRAIQAHSSMIEKYHWNHEIHEGQCVTCYKMSKIS